MSKIIKDKQGLFVEQDCTIKLKGKSFSSGGSWLLKRRDNNKLEGLLYAYPKDNSVGSWDKTLLIYAKFDKEWVNNMGDKRQLIYFEYLGMSFYGIYYKSNSDIVRVKQIGVKQ